MQELDNAFFEGYKRLDRLCSDMYGGRNGVSQYIADMETASYEGWFAVSAWDSSYKTLKHLRWVRNQIAHDSGQLPICEEEDIRDVNDFYDAVMSGQDPLTQLRKYRAAHAAAKKVVARAKPTRDVAPSDAGCAKPTRNMAPSDGDSWDTLLHSLFAVGLLAAAAIFLIGVIVSLLSL